MVSGLYDVTENSGCNKSRNVIRFHQVTICSLIVASVISVDSNFFLIRFKNQISVLTPTQEDSELTLNSPPNVFY